MKVNTNQNEFLMHWVLSVHNEDADNIMVEMVAHEMRLKLEKKRGQGRHGWFGPNCNQELLLRMLNEHLKKGDMIDVINLAGMILARQKLFSEDLPENYTCD